MAAAYSILQISFTPSLPQFSVLWVFEATLIRKHNKERNRNNLGFEV